MPFRILSSLLVALATASASAESPSQAPTPGISAAHSKVPDVESILRILPAPAGLEQVGTIAVYPATKLEEHMGGDARIYGEYGVVEGGAISFGHPGDKSPRITIALHRFDGAKNAFGIFRLQRGDQGDPRTVGAEGVWRSGRLEFWQGPYYASVEGGSPEDSIVACARALSGILPTSGDTLIQMGLFPRATIDGTERWIPRSFLGIKGLNDVWTATCKDSAGTFQVFFRFNRPPLSEEEVRKTGKIVAKATPESPIQMINLSGAEKGKVLLIIFKKMTRYAAGYVGPKPSGKRVTFISNWVDQLPRGR